MLRFVPALLAALAASSTATARAGHGAPIPARPAGRPVIATPAQAIAARSPYLGRFRPEPMLIVTNGGGAGFAPFDNPTVAGAMSLYGPFSRLRSRAEEVVLYSSGFDGRPVPAASGFVYEYPDIRPYRDVSLTPTSYRLTPTRGVTRRSVFGRYLLGQQ